jgi:hypothetical protein
VFLDAKLSRLCVGLKTNENITGKIWGVIVFLMGKALPCRTKEDLAMGLKINRESGGVCLECVPEVSGALKESTLAVKPRR